MLNWHRVLLVQVILAAAEVQDEEASPIAKRALQREHEKPQGVKWLEAFMGHAVEENKETVSLVRLLTMLSSEFLDDCTLMILYDSTVNNKEKTTLEHLLKNLTLPYIHAHFKTGKSRKVKELLKATSDKCVTYILFIKDIMQCRKIIGDQHENKVVIVSKSSQWKVHEFLKSDVVRNFVNLLVIVKSEKITTTREDIPYILYTHDMYIDGLGSSKPSVLTSWYNDSLMRPQVNLFPKKMTKGFAGHRLIISVAEQPPFTIKRGIDTNDDQRWDGTEIRFIQLLSEMLNFTTDFHEAKDAETLGSGDAVAKVIRDGKANLGLTGMYFTAERTSSFEMSHAHSQDCAAFITLTSTALPRYRAIMGPFHWSVWLALTITYLFAIFPIAFSDRLTLMHLIRRPEEMENMFWYVFGTFTNCFTFSGRDSWSKSNKVSTRLFVGWYWVFTIIISACYTGSIIAFVTLPIYPATVDNIEQLISGRYQIGTLDKGGWQYWFENSTDPKTTKLFKYIEYLPDIESGLRNTTKAFFWSYAFLGSRSQLDYIVRTNFTTTNKRSVLHISSECFVPYSVSFAFPKSSVYKTIFNSIILRAYQSGIITKIKNDVEWDIMRSATGKLLQANSVGKLNILSTDDRALTLADTQGMFLLLGVGFLMGGASLLSEWLGGCFNFCKRVRSRSNSIISNFSNDKSLHNPTPLCDNVERSEYTHSVNNIPQINVELVEDTALVHNDHDRFTHEDEDSDTDASSDLEYEISNMFNFDHLFGENQAKDESPVEILNEEPPQSPVVNCNNQEHE